MNAAKYFLILTFGFCGTGWAQLRWDTRSLEFHPSPTDEKVVADYSFTNVGNTPVRIKDVTTSCGCTTAALDKKRVYAPGEKGKITAIFDIAGREGVHQETIYVSTTDPKEPKVALALKTTMTKLLEIDNDWPTWQHGEELKPKIVNLKAAADYPIHHLDATSSSKNIAVTVRHAEGSRDFQLVLTPKKADGEFVIVEIKPDYPKDPPRLFHVYTRVDK